MIGKMVFKIKSRSAKAEIVKAELVLEKGYEASFSAIALNMLENIISDCGFPSLNLTL